MKKYGEALINWLSENVLKAYQEPVSPKSELPYISVPLVSGEFAGQNIQQITIWTRDDASYLSAVGYVSILAEKLGEGGKIIAGQGCKIWIKKGSPFAQNRQDDARQIRAIMINLEVSYY